MIGTIGRLLFLRFMPRKLLPVVAAWQFLRVLRGSRGQQPQDRTRGRARLGMRRGAHR